MDLHGGFKFWIVGKFDICIASAHMGINDAILIPQSIEEFSGVVGISIDIRSVGKQCMRGPPDLPPFFPKKNLAIAANRSVSRPFIAGKGNKPSLLVVELG